MSINNNVPLNWNDQLAAVFQCPICSEQMRLKITSSKSLICLNGHCFDISKQGYVNLLPHAGKTKYNKQLFTSRKILSENGLFDPLIQQISGLINKASPPGGMIKILDAGCGEGSHLFRLHQELKAAGSCTVLGVGVDISKEGVQMASKNYPQLLWCVGDIANCPFQSGQFDFISNILSPSNYSEFQRLLRAEGLIFKVVPNRGYLQELRQLFFASTDKQAYNNDNTLELFRAKLDLLDVRELQYSVTLNQALIPHLVNMTPLSWGADENRKQKVLAMNSLEITIDLSILIGRPSFIPRPEVPGHR
ncbi:MAG: methyltransferase domain-containing protein [Peptococcaceae bacterium]|nr:methyltransferase domain-containing protein [Peptococcaceae bacterium]